MRTLRAEVEAWRRASLLGVLTHEDHDILLSTFPDAAVRLVPDGADHLPLGAAGAGSIPRPEAPLLTFVANFGYAPNVDATRFLCEDILPLIRARVPDVELWLVGTDPPAEVRALAGERVRVTGRVPEIAPYIDAADVVVCPLRVGGGVKVKAIEALRRGKCIVSSTIGAQGLGGAARAALTIADEAEDFAGATARLLLDGELRAQAELRAKEAARTLPTWEAAAAALSRAYGELLSRSSDVAVSA